MDRYVHGDNNINVRYRVLISDVLSMLIQGISLFPYRANFIEALVKSFMEKDIQIAYGVFQCLCAGGVIIRRSGIRISNRSRHSQLHGSRAIA